jgi:hypothetical protein
MLPQIKKQLPQTTTTTATATTMALRLSAAYLVGLSRILNQQYTYTLTDTSKLHNSILAAAFNTSSNSSASLTMLAPEARYDAITMDSTTESKRRRDLTDKRD